MRDLDLVDEMLWEDSEKVEFISLQQADLEGKESDTIGFCIWEHYYKGEQ